MSRHFNEIELQRRAKITKLNDRNIESFSRDVVFSHNSKKLQADFGHYSKPELEVKQFAASIAFRIMTMRGPFLVGQDGHGHVQAYINKDMSQESLATRSFLDIGDIIKVSGLVMKTNTGELTVRTQNLKLITKSLKQLPEKFHGLKNVEERYRRRYVDLIVNKDVKDLF